MSQFNREAGNRATSFFLRLFVLFDILSGPADAGPGICLCLSLFKYRRRLHPSSCLPLLRHMYWYVIFYWFCFSGHSQDTQCSPVLGVSDSGAGKELISLCMSFSCQNIWNSSTSSSLEWLKKKKKLSDCWGWSSVTEEAEQKGRKGKCISRPETPAGSRWGQVSKLSPGLWLAFLWGTLSGTRTLLGPRNLLARLQLLVFKDEARTLRRVNAWSPFKEIKNHRSKGFLKIFPIDLQRFWVGTEAEKAAACS